MNHGFYKVQLTLMASTAQLLNCWKLKWRKLVALLKGHWRSTAKRTGCIGEKSRGTAYGRFEAIRGQLARRAADIGRALPKPSVLKLDGYLDRRLMAGTRLCRRQFAHRKPDVPMGMITSVLFELDGKRDRPLMAGRVRSPTAASWQSSSENTVFAEWQLSGNLYGAFGSRHDGPHFNFAAGKRSLQFRLCEAAIRH